MNVHSEIVRGDTDGETTTATHYEPSGVTSASGRRLVLAHGAGGTQTSPFLVRWAEALAVRGVAVTTFNFYYSERRKKLPDRTPLLEKCYRAVLARAAQRGGMLIAGGKSMGGRIASHLAAQPDAAFAGLVLLGYPLHPPGKPETLRTAHLPSIRCPTLVLQGEHDEFGSPAECAPYFAALPRCQLRPVPGADHSLAVGKRAQTALDVELWDAIVAWIAAL